MSNLVFCSIGEISVQILNDFRSKKRIQLERNETLRLYELQKVYPGATSLQFLRDQVHLVLVPRDGLFYPPNDGWGDRTYYVEGVFDSTATAKTLLPPGEETWDNMAPWELMLPKFKVLDKLSKFISPELMPITTSLCAELYPPQLNANFEKLYGDYEKLNDNDPISSMFKRMDLAIEKRRQKQKEEEERKRASERDRKRRRSRSRDYRRSRSRSRDRRRRRSRSRSTSRRRKSPRRSTSKSTTNKTIDAKPAVADHTNDGSDVEVVAEMSKEDKVGDIVMLSSDEDNNTEKEAESKKSPSMKKEEVRKSSHERERHDRDRHRSDKDMRDRYRSDRDRRDRSRDRSRDGSRDRSRERYESYRYERERSRERYERLERDRRRRSLSAERKRRELEAEEERTRAERQTYAEERRRLREERRKVEEQMEREKWIDKSEDFLRKLGIDPLAAQRGNDYRDFLNNDPGSSGLNSYAAARRSPSRSSSTQPHRAVSPDMMARYGNFDNRTDPLQESRNNWPSQNYDTSFSAKSSNYNHLVEINQLDQDFRNQSNNRITVGGAYGGRRSTESNNSSFIQNQFPRGASASRHSSSPEIEEVQFGRKLGGADTRQQPAQHVPEPTPVPQPLHALKPGNYLVVCFDLVCLGSGLNSELYQLGAYTIHGETFVRCVEPEILKAEAENHKELPMVMFKKKFHVNNRQTGIMEVCVTERDALRSFIEFILINMNRVRPPYTGAVLTCDSNFSIGQLIKRIKNNNLDGQFWSRVSAIGSIEFLAKEHPNGKILLRGYEKNIEDIYYELFKRMRPFDKHFSDEKAKFCYEVLVKLLDTIPSFGNYFQEYAFTRHSKAMQKIRDPTFFLNKWETFAPLRLYVIRTLKSERDGMDEEDLRYLPRVEDISQKVCRNLIDSGFVFEELLDMAKSRGLSSTELQLRTVLLQRMAGQPRNIIDTAIQTTKLVTAFLLHEGHKSLEELLDEVRTSPELMAEYLIMNQEEGEGGVERTGTPSSEGSSSDGSGSDAEPDDGEASTSQPATSKTQTDNVNRGLKFDQLDPGRMSSMADFRKFVANKVMINSMGTWEKGWKSSQYHRCTEVLLNAGLTVVDLAEYNQQPGRVEGELNSKVKPIFNKEGPVHIGFDTFKTWLKEFLDRDGAKLLLNQVVRESRMMARMNMNAGIPKSHLNRRAVLGLPKKKKKKKNKKSKKPPKQYASF